MKKDEVLDTAKTYICGPREQTYGSAVDNFERIARLWSVYLSVPVSASDVACMMILLKMSRLNTTPDHTDSWIDIAGYAACGGEVSSVVRPPAMDPKPVLRDYNA
nr:MAG TPA: Nucleotide modification associated domain 1 [Caudoviricetes sp.]